VNIVEYLERRGHVLKHAGPRSLVTNCPFHPERRPSFWVYPEDDSYYCFSCRTHGYLTALIGVLEVGLPDSSLPGAARWSSSEWRSAFERARELGANVPASTSYRFVPRRPPGASPLQIRALDVASAHYARTLTESRVGASYLQERGLSPELIRAEGLGYSDGSTQSFLALVQKLQGELGDPWREIALSIGLLDQQGRERLRGRIWLPEVRDGHTIYHQARALGPEPARYLSPPVIHRPLYGLASLEFTAPFVVLVEGPFDVFPFHAAGVPAVAILGNRLTEELSLLRGLGERPLIVALDADPTGDEAAERIVAEMSAAGIAARRLRPPAPYKDPGEWAKGDGAAAVVAAAEQLVTRSAPGLAVR